MKVIITGATGYVGEGVLLALLDDKRIEKVLSIGRRPCGHSHEKLEELIVDDLMSLEAGNPAFEGYDVLFFIAGITSVGTPRDKYQIINHDIPVHVASIMPDKERMTFIYLSGAGTSEHGLQNWQKVKSSTECETQAMGFRHAFGWRPMFMKPYPGQKNKQLAAQKAVALFHPLNHLLRVSCTMKEMVDAMYSVAANGYYKRNIESWDIIRISKTIIVS